MLDVTKRQDTAPFDTALLDRLMAEAGIDVLVATSKHNVQYLLGGHRAFFFESMDAMGLSRYLPVFVYQKGAPQKAGFFGHRMEGFQNEVKPFWASAVRKRASISCPHFRPKESPIGFRPGLFPSIPLPCCARLSRMPNSSTRC